MVHGAFNFLILVAALAWIGGLHGQLVLFRC
jgi:lipopolysaccharide transport system permease protein